LLITLPIVLTWFILQFLLKNFDSLSPVFTNILIQLGAPIPEGYRIPFLGLIVTLHQFFWQKDFSDGRIID
jgi:hypothetical protein